MGTFACHCGYVISDSSYPCPWAGDLKWQPELDEISRTSEGALKDLFDAVESGRKDQWLAEFFPKEVVAFYQTENMATIVSDIISYCHGEKGQSVYRCPECECIYLQKEYYTDEWTCYEKRDE